MYGVLRTTCGSNPLWVDDENDFPNALNTTKFFEFIMGHIKEIKMNSYESPFNF